ncbi:hypothetical protein C8Q70DRAFT_1025243 [Cubamyces menziesii]|nr:hypothetical protein C8Q70DRAFT_1025243 [Cubamyces menziesii]
MEKPVASSHSRAVQPYRHYGAGHGARQRQGGGISSKKSKAREITKLFEVFDLPVDIFYEVASHLNPIDLLQLSRASEDLRATILSRKSRLLWVRAFGNVVPEMPPCPEHISEPCYAHAVFERTCDACGVGQSVKVDYATPVRLCGGCWRLNVKKGKELVSEAGLKKTEYRQVLNLLPEAGGGRVGRTPITTLSQRVTNVYYEPEFKAVVQTYRQLLQSKDEVMLQAFLNERRALAIRRLNFKEAVLAWEHKLRELQAVEDREYMEERKLAIEEKLRELGYEPGEYPSCHHDFRAMFDQPRKLTPRIWNTIRPKLIKILDEERKKRAEAAFRNKWQKRIEQFKRHYAEFLRQDRDGELQKRTLPSFEDAFTRARHLVSATEPDADVTDKELTAFEAAVLDYADEYRAQVRASLVELVQQAEPLDAAQPSQKAKRTASGTKDKGKRKTSPSNNSEDSAKEEGPNVEAECALLDAHTSLFTCAWKFAYFPACRDAKSYPDMAEHWQHEHHSSRWSSESAELALHEPTLVPALAVALGLRENSTLSEIREVIHSGRPECTCGLELHLETIQPYEHFAKLLAHADGFNSWRCASPISHHITVKPVC